jgi:hypothetical protein
MSILKNKAQSQAAQETKAAAQAPAFEAGEDRGGDTAVVEREVEASGANAGAEQGGVTDVQHTETVRSVPRAAAPVETEVTEVVNAKAAAGAAAALSKAAAPKEAKVKQETEAAIPAAGEKGGDKVEAAEVKTTAVAVPQRKVLSNFLSGGKDIPNPLADLRDAFAKAGIPIDYNTFQRLRVDAGIISTQDGKEAGTFLELAVVSYSSSWTVSAGDDSEEGKKAVRFSDDGLTIRGAGEDDEHDGKTCTEYRDWLRDNGFEKAAVKEYLNVFGIAMAAEKADFAFMNEIVSVSLSPTSKGKFDNYILNRAVKARMGKIKEDSGNPVVRFTTERTKGKDNKSYFNLLPSDGLTEAPQL